MLADLNNLFSQEALLMWLTVAATFLLISAVAGVLKEAEPLGKGTKYFLELLHAVSRLFAAIGAFLGFALDKRIGESGVWVVILIVVIAIVGVLLTPLAMWLLRRLDRGIVRVSRKPKVRVVLQKLGIVWLWRKLRPRQETAVSATDEPGIVIATVTVTATGPVTVTATGPVTVQAESATPVVTSAAAGATD